MSEDSNASGTDLREILQKEINGYVRRGFHVASQTDTTAQLIKPKKFSPLVGAAVVPAVWRGVTNLCALLPSQEGRNSIPGGVA